MVYTKIFQRWNILYHVMPWKYLPLPGCAFISYEIRYTWHLVNQQNDNECEVCTNLGKVCGTFKYCSPTRVFLMIILSKHESFAFSPWVYAFIFFLTSNLLCTCLFILCFSDSILCILASARQSRFVDTMLVYYWPIVYAAGPVINQHWVNVAYMRGDKLTHPWNKMFFL